MNKKELLEEVLAQIQDLKKDIRDIKKEVSKIADSNNVIFSYYKENTMMGNYCPQCNQEVSSKSHICMSTNCPYKTQVTCSSKL